MTLSHRIAVFSHCHPSISKGGAEIAAYSHYIGLRALGYDAIFVAAVPEHQRSILKLGSGEEIAVFYEHWEYDHFFNLGHPRITKQIEKILTDRQVDLAFFHHFLYFGIDSVRLASQRCRTFVTLHEFVSLCFNHGQMIKRPKQELCSAESPAACAACFGDRTPQQFAIRKAEHLRAFQNVEGFISPSHFLAERYLAWGLHPSQMVVIENGLLRPGLPGASTTLPAHDPWVFGYFGQINPFKGMDTILAACELIAADVELAERIEIRINGNMIGQPEAFVRDFGAAVERFPFLNYAGPYNNEQVGQLMSACHYVVVPSTWWENSPVVIQEAYAARRPVICSELGGMAEKVVDGVSGRHFTPRDPQALADRLAECCCAETWLRLKKGVPAVLGSEDMARRYMTYVDRSARGALIELPDAAMASASATTSGARAVG